MIAWTLKEIRNPCQFALKVLTKKSIQQVKIKSLYIQNHIAVAQIANRPTIITMRKIAYSGDVLINISILLPIKSKNIRKRNVQVTARVRNPTSDPKSIPVIRLEATQNAIRVYITNSIFLIASVSSFIFSPWQSFQH
ncbi:MAG: hypothetical protein HXS46_20050 [Theionarchaea archaeon]|nr:hypothetical protein [Theionarchaea archaeon]